MIINFKFSIGDKVEIKEIETKGIVLSAWAGRRGEEYQVRYCYSGRFEEIYFFEHEIVKIDDGGELTK